MRAALRRMTVRPRKPAKSTIRSARSPGASSSRVLETGLSSRPRSVPIWTNGRAESMDKA
jgi:hypothetical protein